MRVFIVTGEVSGDRYGAALAREIFDRIPGSEVIGVGGEALRRAGAKVAFDSVDMAAVGIWERVRFWRKLLMLRRQMDVILNQYAFDQAIIVDFPHHHAWIARKIRKKGIPITTFVTPNFWIWNDRKKAQDLIDYSERIVTIFPQEFAFYRNLTDKPVFYFGHPLFPPHSGEGESIKKQPIVLVMPGSRIQEVTAHFPTVVAALNILVPKPEVVIPVATPHLQPFIQTIVDQQAQFSAQLVDATEVPDWVQKSRVLVCAAGTSSLLAIKFGVPVLVLGHLSWITTWIVRYVLRLDIPFGALPNILAGRAIVPELQLNHRTPQRIAQAIQALWAKNQPPEAFKRLRAQLTQTQDPFKATVQLLMSDGRIKFK